MGWSGFEYVTRRVNRVLIGDLTLVSLAVAEAVGARWAVALPLGVVVVTAAGALVWRHPVVVVVAGLLLTSTLAARSLQGLDSDDQLPVDAEVTLVSDPVRAMGAVRAEVRLGDHRYDAWARGRAGWMLEARSAGERVVIHGSTTPVALNSWRMSRHLRGRIVVAEVESWSPGNPMARLTNGTRALLMRGSRQLPTDLQPLFGGFVLGDTRGQDPRMADDFRQSGLTHLLVVSGSNVAFVLVAASPLLMRLGFRNRFAVTIALLVFFALLTRMEPSVLRATVMAGLAATGVMTGNPQTSRRLLAAAVVILLVVDPLLVHSAGFALSVAACLGIIFLARPITDALVGPRRLREALGVIIGAQLGVSPVLLQFTRSLPVATLPANLLAEPVAGLIMGWGMTVGLVAGLAPSWLANVLHLPTAAGLWWINSVARWSAAAPLGHLGTVGLSVLGLGVLGVVIARRRERPLIASIVALVALGVAVVVPGGGIERTSGRFDLVTGAVLWQAPDDDGVWGRVLVVDGRVDVGRALSALHERNVGRIDLMVVSSASAAASEAAGMISSRIEVHSMWIGDETQIPAIRGALEVASEVVTVGATGYVGGVLVEVRSVFPKLDVEVSVPGVGSPDATAPDEVGSRSPGS